MELFEEILRGNFQKGPQNKFLEKSLEGASADQMKIIEGSPDEVSGVIPSINFVKNIKKIISSSRNN